MRRLATKAIGAIITFALLLSLNLGTLPANDKPARILFVTQSAGFMHGSVKRGDKPLAVCERVMTELGISSKLFRVDCSQDVKADFTKEKLQHYDIVMFYTTGKLAIDEATLDYFFNTWLKQKNHGFIGTHSAADTFKDYKPYWDMIGGTFNGHPWTANTTVTITNHEPDHPIVKAWGTEFTIKDEIYQFKNWQPEKVRVLMSLNMQKTALKRPTHIPICWCKSYGEGKVFHMSLGHREDVWTNSTYQQSLLGGVKWILGQTAGASEPNPGLSARQQQLAEAAADQ
jgi:type 1 glutamine amidotransferase